MIDKESSNYTNEQLNDLIDEYIKSGRDKPLIKLRSRIEEPEDAIPSEVQEYDKLLFPDNYLDDCVNFMKLMSKIIEKHSSADVVVDKKSKSKKNHVEEAWFVVGVLIATGEINKLKKQFTSSTQIAVHLFKQKEKKYRPWISSSINGETTGQRSIYAYPDKLQKIYDHCINENITMTKEFLKQVKAL
ncbi:MAG: hypothetical protein IPI93_11255 [Sphingobacteriaceae bacterium]|nr:hypothetical protein [Sphingobacteriaceae bacterium]